MLARNHNKIRHTSNKPQGSGAIFICRVSCMQPSIPYRIRSHLRPAKIFGRHRLAPNHELTRLIWRRLASRSIERDNAQRNAVDGETRCPRISGIVAAIDAYRPTLCQAICMDDGERLQFVKGGTGLGSKRFATAMAFFKRIEQGRFFAVQLNQGLYETWK